MTDAVTKPVMRYHGGKFRLADWIMQFFPPHQIYTEAFGGAAGVLLQKPRSYAEVYNDLDGEIVNFFRVLRHPERCADLIRAVTLTPYAREEFDHAWDPTDDLLRPPGRPRPPGKGPSWSTAGSHRTFQGRTWPGRDLGVRAPDDGETPLSRGEVDFILDCMPPMDVLQLFPGSAIARVLVMQAAVEQAELEGRPWYLE